MANHIILRILRGPAVQPLLMVALLAAVLTGLAVSAMPASAMATTSPGVVNRCFPPFLAGLTDADGDGLADSDERTCFRTDPQKWDTDGDGVGDGAEVTFNRTDLRSADSDRDGLSDLWEGGVDPLQPPPGIA